ncbi:MAG TPA: multiheme c-type cytochrome [Fimbriiglobus sp.]
MKRRILAGLFIPVVCWVAVQAATPNPNGSAETRPSVADLAKPFGLLGPNAGVYSAATNCSASNCHGNDRPGSKGGEYTTWAGDDPHHKAYAVLFNDVSVRMMANLKRGPAHEDPQCLQCHAVNEEKHYHGEIVPGRALGEGVSCDACHGPSQAWLGEHFREGWKQLTDREKFEKYQFQPTKDLVARSLMCARCHVGARDREVNHDVIAAGHPRLAFEAARFHFTDNYPKHWTERLPNPGFEMRLWEIGQVAALRQVIDLLAARAERATAKQAPWPELSESSCFACHQDVTGSKNRTVYGERNGRAPGRAGWQVWYTSLIVPKLLPAFDRVKDLRVLMAHDVIDPGVAAEAARKAVGELDAWLAGVQQRGYQTSISPGFAAEYRMILTQSALTDDKRKLRDTDWDFLAQHALALAAVAHALGDASAEWRPLVEKLQAALAFPPDANGKHFNSPIDYDAKTVLELFQALDAKLRARGEQ